MPSKQIYFEDVEVGYEVPSLEKDPTSQQLVKYAALRAISIRSITTRISR